MADNYLENQYEQYQAPDSPKRPPVFRFFRRCQPSGYYSSWKKVES